MRYYYIYILQCSDGSFYTGMSNNAERRLAEHEAGFDPKCYTYKRRPLILVYVECHQGVWQALHREKQIKRWSRQKKMALICEDVHLLKKYAACVNGSSHLNV